MTSRADRLRAAIEAVEVARRDLAAWRAAGSPMILQVRERRRSASLRQMGEYERRRSGTVEIVRGFTEEEDARLIELRLKHYGRGAGGLAAVAKALGRAKSSVQIRLDTIAKREEG